MKAIPLLLLFVTSSLKLWATAQYPDKLWYKGKEYDMHTNPMEAFFEKHPDRKPKNGIISTALWRGYVATFEIKNDQLLLKDIEIKVQDTGKTYQTKWVSVLKEVFPNQQEINIDWYTGLLVLPHGKLVNYVHMGYGSTYEKYILLEIGAGKLTQEKKLDYKAFAQFREQQFEAFRKTDEYKKLKTDLQKNGSGDEFIDDFLKNFIMDYIKRSYSCVLISLVARACAVARGAVDP
ncbi:hypothetical protein [Paraflavitalea speifideaquila]|uniref:hypothetical protein n=1 Tax=Paraflavitalea speifideaquila TaxID=3076558 RepID=UPI0028F000D1|nr:hypothetical protein [Paraflavitalea speifideiaquila]